MRNDLIGEVPPEIGQLRNLRILHLLGNCLHGTIPEEIGQLDGPRLSAEETQDPWGARLGEVSLLKLAVLNNTEKCYHT